MPKLVNALLVQSKTDWFWVEAGDSITGAGRQEDTLALTYMSTADATRAAQQYLGLTANPQTSVQVQVEPFATDLPHRDYDNGDTITVDLLGIGLHQPMVVVEQDYATDEEGWAIPTPVLNTRPVNAWLKLQAWLRANQGGLGGQAAQASQAPVEFDNIITGKIPAANFSPFSFSGLVSTGKATPPTSPSQDVRLTVLTVKAPPADPPGGGGHAGYVGTGSNSVFAVFYRLKGTGASGTMIGSGGGTYPDIAHPGWLVLTPTTYELNVYVGNEFIAAVEEIWAVCLSAGGHTDVSVQVNAAPLY